MGGGRSEAERIDRVSRRRGRFGAVRRRTATCITISVLMAGLAAAELQTSGAAVAAPCPTPQSGTWIGTWVSSGFALSGASEAELAFTGSVVSGTMTLTTGTSVVVPGDAVSGSVSCDVFNADGRVRPH